MRDTENIREVEQLSIDWMGFIFWPKSRRYVSTRPTYLPQNVKRVGVFVDENPETIKQMVDDYALDIIQLHGHESPEQISQFPILNPQLSIIKAFNIATVEDLSQTKPYEDLADYFLFDTKATFPGGSGRQFDWSILNAYNSETPFLLSGGIGPDDAERVRAFHHPRCIGIDLNSRFEIEPALKDTYQLKEFIKQIR
jgi:phosphoribosylanthranilate isomerase